MNKDLYLAYQDMAHDEIREKEAIEWAEETLKDVQDELQPVILTLRRPRFLLKKSIH